MVRNNYLTDADAVIPNTTTIRAEYYAVPYSAHGYDHGIPDYIELSTRLKGLHNVFFNINDVRQQIKNDIDRAVIYNQGAYQLRFTVNNGDLLGLGTIDEVGAEMKRSENFNTNLSIRKL